MHQLPEKARRMLTCSETLNINVPIRRKPFENNCSSKGLSAQHPLAKVKGSTLSNVLVSRVSRSSDGFGYPPNVDETKQCS